MLSVTHGRRLTASNVRRVSCDSCRRQPDYVDKGSFCGCYVTYLDFHKAFDN